MSDADLARDLHQQLLAARRDHRRAEHTLAVLLTRFADGALFVELGYATVYEYAREVLDLGARRARDLLHIGRSLPDLPVLDAAFAGGELGWTKARELLRVATPDNEAAWVETAQRVNSRTLERLVAATPVGDPPPPDDEPRAPSRTRMIFDLHTADADHIRTAVTMLRQQTPGSEDLSDGQLLALMAQRVLHDAEGSEVPTGDRYRVLLQHCPNCGHTTGVCSEADETIVNEACCDHDLVDLRPGPGEGTLTRSIRPSVRRKVLYRFGGRCAVPGCTNRLWIDIHHEKQWSKYHSHDPRYLIPLCSCHHRLVHEGWMAIEHIDGDIVFTFSNGRVLVRKTHVGRRNRDQHEARTKGKNQATLSVSRRRRGRGPCGQTPPEAQPPPQA